MRTAWFCRPVLFPVARVAIVGILCAVASARAQEAKPRDYSRGFQKFYDLGLPDVKGARYAKLDYYSARGSFSSGGMHEYNLQGNAWLLKENKEGISLFVVDSCRVVEVYDHEKIEKEMKAKATQEGAAAVARRYGRSVMFEGKNTGRWKDADLKKDVAKVLEGLKKQTERKRGRYSSFSVYEAGPLFLFSIHCHRQGFTNEANTVVDQLFAAANNPQKVIAQAVGTLANAQYDDVCTAFFEKRGTWESYGADLEKLVQKFPSGWQVAPAVRRVADAVKARAGQTQAPALTGTDLSEEDQVLARELAAVTNLPPAMMYGMRSSLWILPEPKKSVGAKKPSDHPLDRIVRRGVKSLPLLAALVGDPYLVLLDSNSQGGGSHYYSYDSDDALSEDVLKRMHQGLRRPLSRGDIAVQLVSTLVPAAEDERDVTDLPDNDLRDRIKAWYGQCKDKSDAEIARLYMKNGNESQRQRAAVYLVRHGTDADIAEIEKLLLKEGDDPWRSMQMATKYVQTRGEKAKDFLAKYEAALKKRKPADDEENPGANQWVEQSLASLRAMVSPASAKALLDDLVTGKKTWSDAQSVVWMSLGKLGRDEALTALLEASLRATNATTAARLVGVTPYVSRIRDMSDMSSFGGDDMEEPEEEENAPAEEKLDIPDLKTHLALWKKITADTRKVSGDAGEDDDESPAVADSAKKMTVGEAALDSLEALYGREPERMRGDWSVLGMEATRNIMRARAQARLAGKAESELPPYPSADNVKEADRAKLFSSIQECKHEDALRTLIAALTPDQHLALADDIGEKPEVNAKLAPFANRIAEVELALPAGVDGKDFTAFQGKPLSTGVVARCVSYAKDTVARGNAVVCQISRLPSLKGLALSVREVAKDDKDFERRTRGFSHMPSSFGSLVMGMLYAGDLHAQFYWKVEPKTPPATKAAGADDDRLAEIQEHMQSMISGGEREEDFWQKVAEYCRGKGNVYGNVSLTVSGAPAREEKSETQRVIRRRSVLVE